MDRLVDLHLWSGKQLRAKVLTLKALNPGCDIVEVPNADGYYHIVKHMDHGAAALDRKGQVQAEVQVTPFSRGYAFCLCGLKVYARYPLTLEDGMSSHVNAPDEPINSTFRVMSLDGGLPEIYDDDGNLRGTDEWGMP